MQVFVGRLIDLTGRTLVGPDLVLGQRSHAEAAEVMRIRHWRTPMPYQVEVSAASGGGAMIYGGR